MHKILYGNYMIIKITWRNYGKEFDNLLRKIIELGWVKPKKPWVFITKPKQGSLTKLEYDLIFKNQWILVLNLFLVVGLRGEEENMVLILTYGWECGEISRYLLKI